MGFRLDGSTTLTSGGDPLQASFFGQSSFARHAVVSPDNAVRVAADADLTRLGPFGCAFQTGAGAVLHVLEPGTDDALVVYGVGAVGLTAIATAKARGVGTVVAVDLKPERLSAAAELGADTLNPADLEGAGLADRIRELTGGGASHALDTTGVATVIRDAGLALRPRGTLVVLGLGDAEISLDAVDLMMNGKVVRGSVEGDGDPHQVIPELIRMAQEGSLPVDGFITTYLFAEINQAAADLLSGAAIKPVLVWE
jgi:aryl-alcohol dehydrogenase